jgi:type VI protein secretion system component VasK
MRGGIMVGDETEVEWWAVAGVSHVAWLVLCCVWVAPALSKRLEKELPREKRGRTKTKEEVTALIVYCLSLLLDSY